MSVKQKTDWREVNIANRMSRCIHFTGLMGPGMERRIRCDAGVEYSTVDIGHEPMPYQRHGVTYHAGRSLPCFAAGTSGNLAGATCEKRCTMTREEAEADERRLTDEIQAMGVARKAIVEHVEASGQYRGAIPCPTCKTGTLRYSRAVTNKHVHARCSTDGCHAWME
jgi:hypothetical protein